jgi:hypothetical protein
MSAKEYFDSDGKALDARFHITQDHLSDQDLRKLDVTSLNPLSPEVSFKNLQKMQRPNCILKQTSPLNIDNVPCSCRHKHHPTTQQ